MAPAFALPGCWTATGSGARRTSTSTRSTRRSPPRCWPRWRRGATRCSRARSSGATQPVGEIDRSKLNVNGGSLAAGHPFAATGGRIVASLAKALQRARRRAWRDLDLRGGRAGRRRDPGGVMSDRYSQLVKLPVAGTVGEADRAAAAGRRWSVAASSAAACCSAARAAWPRRPRACWPRSGVDAATALDDPVRAHAAAAGLDAAVFNPEAPADRTFKALVFDATGIADRGL